MQKISEWNEYKNLLLQKVRETRTALESCGIIVYRNELDQLEKQCEDKQFRITMMGRWCAGKTGVINTLLGREILPQCETSVTTEIHNGECNRVRLYPHGDRTGFDIFGDETQLLKNYYHLKNYYQQNPVQGENSYAFDKFVAYSDAEILKNSVIFTEVTYEECEKTTNVDCYCKTSDMILYCIPATAVYSEEDKRILNQIQRCGFHNLYIVATSFLDLDDTDKADVSEQIYSQLYSDYVTEDACICLDSKLGFEAKQENNSEKLIESGYKELEKLICKQLKQCTENKRKVMGDDIDRLTEKIDTMASAALQLIDIDDSVFYEALGQMNHQPKVNTEFYKLCVNFVTDERSKYRHRIEERKSEYRDLLSEISRIRQ